MSLSDLAGRLVQIASASASVSASASASAAAPVAAKATFKLTPSDRGQFERRAVMLIFKLD